MKACLKCHSNRTTTSLCFQNGGGGVDGKKEGDHGLLLTKTKLQL